MSNETNQKRIRVAIEWIKKLAEGINPIDGSIIPDNDIVNNVHISRCLFFVANMLENVDRGRRSFKKEQKVRFQLTAEMASDVYIAEKTGIAMFVREINKVIPENMQSLSMQKVTQWLVSLGYLDERIRSDGHKYKVPTELGTSIGITSVWIDGRHGRYPSVSYDANAQLFLLENISKVI